MAQNRNRSTWIALSLLAGCAAGAGVVIWVALRRDPRPQLQPREPAAELPIGPTEPMATGLQPTQAPQSDPDQATDDETALARMLASEDADPRLQVVIGWITIQRALRARRSLYSFLTRGKGYGPFYEPGSGKKKASGRHAATGKRPTEATRRIARALLSGRVVPSPQILEKRPGSWIERTVTLSDEQVIAKQVEYKEGIYGQVAGTKWVLFSPDVQPISIAPFQTATDRLDSLPKIPATQELIS